jgi:hypothetical protein
MAVRPMIFRTMEHRKRCDHAECRTLVTDHYSLEEGMIHGEISPLIYGYCSEHAPADALSRKELENQLITTEVMDV